MSNEKKTDKVVSTNFLTEKNTVLEKFEYYKGKMKNKEIIEIFFSAADPEGNLYIYDNGIRIQLDNIDIKGTIYEPRYRANALTNKYAVMVKSVDEEKKEVRVSHNKAKRLTKKELIKEIDDAIKKSEPMTVIAVVKHIKDNNYCIIDIGGVGIAGKINIGEWTETFTGNYRMATQRGEIIKVVARKKVLFDGKLTYDCSRKDAIEVSPWAGIEDRLPKDTVVNITCTSKENKKFWGIIEGIDELNVYCEYPDKEKNLFIQVGAKYQGYIYAVNEETELLKARVFKALG